MARDISFPLWAGRLCLGVAGTLSLLGTYYGNIRFAPIALGFAVLAAVSYTGRLRPIQAPRFSRQPSLTSDDGAHLSPHSPHSLGS